MAVETEIDSLVLDISVKDNEGKESSAKKISTLDRVLNRFQKTVLNLDTKSFKSKFASMTTALKPFVNELNSAKSSILALSKVMSKLGADGKVADVVGGVGTQDTKTQTKNEGNLPGAQSGKAQQLDNENIGETYTLNSIKKNYGELTQTIENADKTKTLFFSRFDGSNRVVTKFTAEMDKNGNIVEKSLKKVNQVSKDVSGDGLKAFFLSIKRIALYRVIRSALKWITASLKEGIVNITAYDEKYNQTMSEITSSITVMKNSFGAMITPLLELVQPIIEGISRAVGTLANGISYLTAKLKGESTWMKVNLDYLKEYNEQSKLLSFDTFSSLSNSNDTSGMFTTESMSGSSMAGILDDCTALAGVLAGIATTLGIIGVSKIIGLITGGTLIKSITALWSTTLDFLGTINGLAVGIGALVAGLVYFIASFNDMSTVAKILIPIIAVLAATLTGLAVAHAAAKAGLAAPAMAGITAAAIAAGIALAAGTAIAVSQHANGGMFEGTGTIYHQAGEAGAEIVAQGSRGTGVTNISQFKQAMVEALSEYNAARNTDDVGTLVVQLDGKEIARSQVQNNASALMKNYNIVLKPR
jgi:hypothetical protein